MQSRAQTVAHAELSTKGLEGKCPKIKSRINVDKLSVTEVVDIQTKKYRSLINNIEQDSFLLLVHVKLAVALGASWWPIENEVFLFASNQKSIANDSLSEGWGGGGSYRISRKQNESMWVESVLRNDPEGIINQHHSSIQLPLQYLQHSLISLFRGTLVGAWVVWGLLAVGAVRRLASGWRARLHLYRALLNHTDPACF